VPRRIDAGEVLAAVGGVVVLVALFLTWFSGTYSGWEAFESLDLVIAVLASIAVLAAIASLTGWSSGPSPRVLPWVGVVLLAIIAVQLIEPPPTIFTIEVDERNGTLFGDDPDREVGAWLALGGSALVFLGGLLRAARISVTVSVGGRDVRRRVPAVDRRPVAADGDPPVDAAPAGSAAAPVMPEPDQATQPFTPAPDPHAEDR
jgi:hypothetical protein